MKNPTPRTTKATFTSLALIGLLLIQYATPQAHAADAIWTGGGVPNGNWQTANNWGGVAPAAADSLFFDGSLQTSTTNDFASGTTFGNLTFNPPADPFTLYGNSITLIAFTNGIDGSTINPLGGNLTNSSFNTEIINLPVTLSAGRHTVTTVGGGQLNLNGAVSRDRGATVVFAPLAGNINVTGGLDTNGLNNILGGWATLGNDWATLDANSNIVAYTDYTFIASGGLANAPASNVKYVNDTANITAATGTTINSLLTEQSGNRSLTITGQLRLGAKGGIYRDGIGSGVMTITGGSLVADGGGELTFSDSPFNATGGNNLNIVSVISDDGANVVSVNIMGYVQFGASASTVNTYSGGTYINQGRVQITPLAGFGTGPVHVFPSGEILFNSNGTFANNFFIGGVGTAESGGLGAFRMGGAGRILTGTITLMGDAVIGNNGRISGPITGPGRLFIGHGTSNNGHGVIQVGGAVPNDYSGDTVIGSANQAADTLQINSGFDNVMPHGTGKGNVILNGGAAAITATFDLNGTTQTINGLANTAVNPGNDRVTSTVAATLILGDNNATASFDGTILNSVAITKIGGGIQTFSGANTYTNGTTVNAGTLVFSTAGSFPPGGSPAVNINSNGTLNVAAVCPLPLGAGSTLNMSNGTIVVELQSGGNAITTPTLTAIGATNFVTIAAIPSVASYPAQFVAIKFTTLNGALNFGLAGSLPASPGAPFTGYISNNVANGSVDFVVTGGPSTINWVGYSSGAPNSAWDIGTANWATLAGTPTAYADGVFVQFKDSASNGVVTLSQNVSPAGTTITNDSLSYLLNGGGAINGTGGLTKRGTGTFILDNSGINDFAGDVTISAGTLQIGNHDTGGSLPAANAILDNGALVFARADFVIVPNVIAGTGTVTQNDSSGTLDLTAINSFTGATTVAQGTLRADNNAALGGTNGSTTVSSGATLEIVANAINLGQEQITLSGAGVGGAGALVNNSASPTFVGPNAARVTLAGDTTVGGNGRFDLRSATTSNPLLGSLSTGGQPYKLTKVGTGTFGLIGITVDPQLGDIEVQQGIFSTEAAMTTLGNPARNVIVWPGGTFQMFAITNELNKVFTLGGDGTTFTLSATSGGNTIVGPMAVTNDCIFSVNGAAVTLTLNNVITGPGRITKVGAGLLTLSGNSSTYAGGLLLNAGSATLSGTLSNSLGVTASVGKFTLDGTLLGAGVTNAGLSILAGSGSSAGLVDVSGSMFPGDTNVVGTFTAGGLVLEPGANLSFDLAGTNTVGSGTNDLIIVNGDLTVNGNSITINPLGLLQTGASHPYRLFSYTGSLFWNGDLTVMGPNNYVFTVNTNTAGQVNIVASGGPPVWDGGSATVNNWSDPANWGGVTIAPGDTLYFAGVNRLNNNNNTTADTSYTDLAFNNDAGAFVLNGNSITLGGNIINNSPNTETVNLALSYSSSRTFNGAAGTLIIGGSVTNTATALTLTLSGTGMLTNLLSATDPNSMTNILSVSSNSTWTLVDNAAATPVTLPIQLDIVAGTFNFGLGDSAPTLISTAQNGLGNNARIGIAAGIPATFNMVNGTFTIAARLNTGSGANTIAVINQTGGAINVGDVIQFSDSAPTALTTANISGGSFNAIDPGGLNNFFLASRGTGIVTVASSGTVNCATLDMSRNAAGNTLGSVGVVNLDGGILAASRVGAATSAAQAGGTPSATFNFNGGTLKANASSTTFFQGNAAAPAIPITSIVKSGGAIIDTTNFNISVLEPLQHDSSLGAVPDGGLTKQGTGALTLTAASTYTGPTVVNDGTLLVNGSVGATAVSVESGGTLGGSGNIGNGVVVKAGGTISAGAANATGNLTVAGNVTLQAGAIAFMELNKTAATSDQVRAIAGTATTITYAGTLSLTNLAGTLAGGESFKLFSASNYLGSFNSIAPASPGAGLLWITSALNTSGTISVAIAPIPKITAFGIVGGSVVLSGTNGPAGNSYWVLTSTDVSLPISSWTSIATNNFDGSGNFSFTNGAPSDPQRYYLLQVP